MTYFPNESAVSSSFALLTLVTADDDGAAIRSLQFFAENIPDLQARRAYGRMAPISVVPVQWAASGKQSFI